MTAHGSSTWFLVQEARALLTRLACVQPFSWTVPHVTSAAPSAEAWTAIERHLVRQRRALHQRVDAYLRWLEAGEGRRASPGERQRRFTVLRLRFCADLDQLDIFADVLGQRAEHKTGTWLAGLDVLAADALALPERYFEPPPMVTYLDRGHGAAIRRVRTRLPGGGRNPVAIVRVPRERMVGGGIGTSLVHEVGHQAAALLGLVDSLRAMLRRRLARATADSPAWTLWERWIGEIIADYWSVGTLGITASAGLCGVLSLPRALVFRIHFDGAHPAPWIRARLSCAMGWEIHPDPQWGRLSELWHQHYPTGGLVGERRRLLALLEDTIPELVERIAEHRPPSLWGKSLREVMSLPCRRPDQLRSTWARWRATPRMMCGARPTLVLAALGQARWDGLLSPAQESAMLDRMLERWALARAMPHAVTPTECGRSLTRACAT